MRDELFHVRSICDKKPSDNDERYISKSPNVADNLLNLQRIYNWWCPRTHLLSSRSQVRVLLGAPNG
jgi:hypothetical protein